MLLEHNIPVYEAFAKMLDDTGEVFLVSDTGTGKSYITNEYVATHNCKTLIVSPGRDLRDRWLMHIPTGDSITYQLFYRKYEEFYNKYDLVVFDEAHHLGSPVWGAAFLEYRLNCPDTKIIALSADPRRYSDKDRDVSIELFHEHIVHGYDRDEAIRLGILPDAMYVKAVFSVKHGSRITGATDKTLRGRLSLTDDVVASMYSILHESMPNGLRKGIVFTDRIDGIDQVIRVMSYIFPDEPFRPMHSKMDRDELDANREWFYDADHGYIVTVNMFNEGLHIPGVNTVIMMRKTNSATIYKQQTGRAMCAGNENVFIYDFVGNFASLKVDTPDNPIDKHVGGTSKLHLVKVEDEEPPQIIVDAKTEKLEDVLVDVQMSIDSQRWTIYDDGLLIEYYERIGSIGMHKNYFPNKSTTDIRKRAEYLGIGKDANYRARIPWTAGEDRVVIRYYRDQGAEWIAQILRRRSVDAIHTRAKFLNIAA